LLPFRGSITAPMDIMVKRRLLFCTLLLLGAAAWGPARWAQKPLYFGPHSDIYPRWLGSRELFLHGIDPYSERVTQEIQVTYYGHALAPGEDRDEQRFAYPIYVSFLLLPTILLPFTAVQVVFVILLGLAVMASVILWLRAIQWELSKSWLLLILILALCNPAAFRGLKLQQLGLLVAALLAGATFSAMNGRLALAGMLLGFATIKPQTMALPLIWFLIWCMGDWSKRKSLAITFFATTMSLCLAGELLVHGWMVEFIKGMIAYRRYAGYTGLEVLFGRSFLAALGTALIILWIGLRMWRNKGCAADSPQFMLQLSSILAISLFIVPGLFDLYNLVLSVPGVFILLRPRSESMIPGTIAIART